MFSVPEGFRAAGLPGLQNGIFRVPVERDREGRPWRYAKVVASASDGWEHVSVTLPGERRCPTWAELEAIRRLFWGDEDVVMQLHVPPARHVNMHEFCLHLWRQAGRNTELPPAWMV